MGDFIDLSGKTVLVTGGSRGIGEAIVRSLVREGANVVFNYAASREKAEAIAEELGRDRCLPIQADLARWQDQDRLFAEAVAWKGRLDVLVNNASVRQPVALDAPTEEWTARWQHALQVNLVAAANLSRLAIRHYQKHGGGIIIGITARIAVRGDRPEYYHDGASKGGMNSLLRGIARFFATDNICTYLLCVGVAQTKQADDMTSAYGEEVMREIPFGRFATPEEVANLVVICSSDKVRYSSGTTIDITGASFLH